MSVTEYINYNEKQLLQCFHKKAKKKKRFIELIIFRSCNETTEFQLFTFTFALDNRLL